MTEDEKRQSRRAANKKYRDTHADKCRAYAGSYRAAHKRPRPVMPQSKVCTHCGINKQRDDFYNISRVTFARTSRGGLGVEPVCKECRSHLRKPTLRDERAYAAQLATDGLKRCGTCVIAKPISEFAVRKPSPDGLAYTCRDCSKRRTATWKRQHPTAHAEWYAQNREHKRMYWSQWREKNAEHIRKNYKRWAQQNPEKVNALVAKRIAIKLHATPTWADLAAIGYIYARASELTRVTGVRHEVDHIVPLRNPIVCGLHVPANLQVLTGAENRKKGNRFRPHIGLPLKPCDEAQSIQQPYPFVGPPFQAERQKPSAA